MGRAHQLNASLLVAGWFALLASTPPVFGAAGIRVVETRSLPLDRVQREQDAPLELQLHLYMFWGTRWSARQITTAVTEATGLVGQCGVVLSRAELQVIEAPTRFRYYDTSVSRELLRRIEVSRPAVFFVEDTRNNPAFDAETIGRGNAVGKPELTDTAWIAYDARDLPQTMAHELVHLLSNSGEHSTAPANLMRATTSRRNTRLTAAQCARLRSVGEANGLLVRRPSKMRK